MRGKRWGLVFFVLGVVVLHVYTTGSFLWALAGGPLATYPLLLPRALRMFTGLVPPVGAFLLVIGGVVYGWQARR